MAQHLFTVNAEGKRVIFSPGNLYWNGTEFAEDTDALGYGTTTWDPNHVDGFYWSKDAAIARALEYKDPERAISDKFFAADGGAIAGKTVLSRDEWEYLLNTRPNASALYRNWVYIVGEKYLVIAPDDFTGTIPANMTAAEWGEYRDYYGLVALAAAGIRYGSNVYYVGGSGGYWSSTADGSNSAYYVRFNSGGVDPGTGDGRSSGSSVRLVQVYEDEQPKLFHSGLVATLRDWIKSHFVGEAPEDGKQYVRKDADWAEVDTEGTVHYDQEQTLTASEQAQARENIGAQEVLVAGTNITIAEDGKTISAEGGVDATEVTPTTPTAVIPVVEYVPQTLTAAQQAQARQNIGALAGTLDQYPTRADFPDAGNPTTIYLDQQTGATYRWDTSTLTYKSMGSNQNPVPGPDTGDGIYIKYTDGSISAYDVLIPGKTPVGVALINKGDGVRLVMHPNEGNAIWQTPTGLIPGTFNSSGKNNTDLILAQRDNYSVPAAIFAREGCIYADGSEGQLPSMAEMEMFLGNATEVNIAMELIGGTTIARTRDWWSSNQYADLYAWLWSGAFQAWFYNAFNDTKLNSKSIRSVAAF